MSEVPYANAVGCLMYLMLCTKPNISYAVNVVSRYMTNPVKEYWNVVKWIFRCLAGARDLRIMFDKKVASTSVMGYVNVDYVGDLDSRSSTTGFVFMFASGRVG